MTMYERVKPATAGPVTNITLDVAKWVLGYPSVSDARGPVQLGERHPAAEGEVYRFFLEKLLRGERKTSGC